MGASSAVILSVRFSALLLFLLCGTLISIPRIVLYPLAMYY